MKAPNAVSYTVEGSKTKFTGTGAKNKKELQLLVAIIRNTRKVTSLELIRI